MIDPSTMTPAERVKLAEDCLAISLADLVRAYIDLDREMTANDEP